MPVGQGGGGARGWSLFQRVLAVSAAADVPSLGLSFLIWCLPVGGCGHFVWDESLLSQAMQEVSHSWPPATKCQQCSLCHRGNSRYPHTFPNGFEGLALPRDYVLKGLSFPFW